MFKVGEEVICKYVKYGVVKKDTVIIEHIGKDYTTVRKRGALGGTLHLVCHECLRKI